MLTIFTIPKAFEGQIGLIQKNAIASWRRLDPTVQIVLFGDSLGTEEVASEFAATHECAIACNSFGTPLVSDAFVRARILARTPLLMYSNTDILYDETILEAIDAVAKMKKFVLSGRRWDLDVSTNLEQIDEQAWRNVFLSRFERGRLHGPAGMDYFLFPREMSFDMPAFAVGRVGWDSWLVWSCRRRNVPMIDATNDVVAIHQNHGYADLPLGYQHMRGPERDLNLRKAGGLSRMMTLRESSLELVKGEVRSPRGMRAIFSFLGKWRVYSWCLAVKRWFQAEIY